VIDKVYELWQQERTKKEITPISISFYSALRENMKEWEKRIEEENNKLAKAILRKQYERTRYVIEDVIKIRTKKIIELVLRGREVTVNIAREELAFYDRLKKAYERYLKEIFSPEEVAFIEEDEEKERKTEFEVEYTIVRLIEDVNERITGLDGHFYGPFKKGDIAIIPKENAMGLTRHKIAEKIKI